MTSVKPKKSPSVLIIALIIGAAVCLLAVVAILVVNGGPHKQPNLLTLVIAGNNASSNDKISAATSVLRDRFNALGCDASVSQIIDNNGRAFIYVFYGNISTDRVTAIATTPGHFEMQIQTAGNQSDYVLSDTDIKSASCSVEPGTINGSAISGVSIVMTPDGAAKFRQKCIEVNATGDPLNHSIITIMDGQRISAIPLSTSLGNRLPSNPVDVLVITTGSGDEGLSMAEKLSASLAGGELPAPLKVAGT